MPPIPTHSGRAHASRCLAEAARVARETAVRVRDARRAISEISEMCADTLSRCGDARGVMARRDTR
jgi:hypothetical protein